MENEVKDQDLEQQEGKSSKERWLKTERERKRQQEERREEKQ